MGQQQLLLIIVGVIIVGIAVAGGIVLFKSQAMGQNRDAVWTDLNQLAARAQAFYRRPSTLGGGGKSFAGFSLVTEELKNGNGDYSISSKDVNEVVIQGKGREMGNNQETPVLLNMVVHPDTIYIDEGTIN
jgi:hypothetical protein